MADLTLSFADQRIAVYERRFPASANVTQWLAAAYTDVWNAARWTFKRAYRETWYTTDTGLVGGTATAAPDMPDTFAEVHKLFDNNGSQLVERQPDDFDYRIAGPTITGVPSEFTVVNRQIHLYPTPTSALAFTISYRRKLCTRTAAGLFQTGFYTQDTDIPAWDDHHYLLVLRAKIIGLRDRSDPTAGDLEEEYARLLEAMRADYVETLPRGTQVPAWR